MREDEKRIVLGSKRFVTNTDNPVWIQLPLAGEIRDMVEGERTILINQQTQFEEERQESGIFRISGKIVNLFDNIFTGSTQYSPFKNSLYYTNSLENAISNATNPNAAWEGYPQFYEFTFFRELGIDGHIPFTPKSASSYNWMFYVSYAFSSDTTQRMSWTSEKFGVTNSNFLVSDGIPFVIENGKLNGKDVLYFYCATNHNLSIGDFVEIKLPYQPNGIANNKIFQVYSLGDGTYNSEKNVFTIFNLRFPQNETQTGTYGNFRRIANITNSAETKSKYYIRLHKTLSNEKDVDIFKSGFDKNAFITKSKVEYSALTPNNIQRVSVKDDNQNYSFSFSKDININGLRDNNNKPLTELFLTIVNRGYMGYFNPPTTTQIGTPTGLDIGWGFNFLKNTEDTWWDHSSTLNKDEIPISSYNVNSLNFYYNELLPEGSIIKGDFCEYNDFELQEYFISPLVHKYSFNPTHFWDSSTVTFPSGYFYNPHHSIKIRSFSDYIETGEKKDSFGVPDYAWFSEKEQKFYWKDIYSYGYIDSNGNGVDYPFINGAHYPFNLFLFKQYPSKRSIFVETTQINTIQNDGCE